MFGCGETTYAALQWATIDIVTRKLADGHCGVLVGVHLDESEAAVRLEASFNDVSEILEKRDKIILGGVWGEVSDVAGSLPLWSLGHNHLVALSATGWEAMVGAVGSSGCHSHSLHRLLMRKGWLSLLIRPVATDCTRAKPFPVHGAEGLFSFTSITERHKAVATRSTGFHIPHDSCLRHTTKGRESLVKNFVVHLVAEVADENVEVIRGVFLVVAVGLISPIHFYFLHRERFKCQSECGVMRRTGGEISKHTVGELGIVSTSEGQKFVEYAREQR